MSDSSPAPAPAPQEATVSEIPFVPVINFRRVYIPRRLLLVLLLFYGAVVDYMIRINTSVTIVPMSAHFHWSSRTQGLVLSSFYIGYAPTQILGGILAHRFGSKRVIWYGMTTAILLNFLVPLAAYWLPVLVALRVGIGLSEAVFFPAATQLLGMWIPSDEIAFASSVAYNGALVGTVAVFFVSPLIVKHVSWQASFYIYGSVGLLWSLLWFLNVEESPERSANIAPRERALILQGRAQGAASTPVVQRPPIRWCQFLHPQTAVLVVSYFANSWAFNMMLSWVPTYLNDKYDMPLDLIGLYQAAAYAGQFLATITTAKIGDELMACGVPLVFIRKFFLWLQNLACCVFLSFITLGRGFSATQIAWFLTGAIVSNGLSGPTSAVPNDLAYHTSGLVQAIRNTASNLPGIVAVWATGYLVHTKGSWENVFGTAQLAFIVGAVVWIFGYHPKRVFD